MLVRKSAMKATITSTKQAPFPQTSVYSKNGPKLFLQGVTKSSFTPIAEVYFLITVFMRKTQILNYKLKAFIGRSDLNKGNELPPKPLIKHKSFFCSRICCFFEKVQNCNPFFNSSPSKNSVSFLALPCIKETLYSVSYALHASWWLAPTSWQHLLHNLPRNQLGLLGTVLLSHERLWAG